MFSRSLLFYPIAYDKWIREQVEEILGMPDLYSRLPGLLEISHFESDEIAQKAEELRTLVEEYIELDNTLPRKPR